MSGEFTADKQLKNRADSIILQIAQLNILSREEKEGMTEIIKGAISNQSRVFSKCINNKASACSESETGCVEKGD